MSTVIFAIIIIVIAASAGSLFFLLNIPIDTTQNSNITPNQSSQPSKTNQTVNISLAYMSNCVNSTRAYTSEIVNIMNLTEKETRIFNKSKDVESYLTHNWSNTFYDINGTKKDIVNNTVVSIFEIITNRGRNFTLPILCDTNGSIGKYSSCLLNNIPNIPDACYNLTINLSDCENEWANHFIFDDIQYWITPEHGTFIVPSAGFNNTSVTFNFTINSSRRRLEYYGMEITERTFSPLIDRIIFSSTKMSKDGKGGSITYKVNITNKKGVEFYSTAWFKKLCYDKYIIY